MKAYGGSGGIAPVIFRLGTRCRPGVQFTLPPFDSRKNSTQVSIEKESGCAPPKADWVSNHESSVADPVA